METIPADPKHSPPTGHVETTINLGDIQVAAKIWGRGNPNKVLALHGWLDNAASFDRLAPLLLASETNGPSLDAEIVAIDLPGHGWSEHRPHPGSYEFMSWIPDIAAVVDSLEWKRFSLLGHSLGAAIATITAVALTGRVTNLTLLDAIGPISADESAAPGELKNAVKDRTTIKNKRPRSFPTFESGVSHLAVVNSALDQGAACLLGQRGLKQQDDGQWVRCHDRRLEQRSLLKLSEAQVLAFTSQILCPVLVIRARAGWPIPARIIAARVASLPQGHLVEVDGKHHVHLVEPNKIARQVRAFLSR